MPYLRREGMCPAGMESSLYQNCLPRQNTKPTKTEKVCCYKTPRDKKVVKEELTLEKELDANSVLNFSSQSSMAPNSQQESAGPNTPPHFSGVHPAI